MKTTANNAVQESIVDFCLNELDQIYYPGYCEDLFASDPTKFDWELEEFKGQFSV